MNYQRPPQRPGRPPLTREEYMRRQAYFRRKKRREMQKRIAILAIAALFILFTIILISVALHRSDTPANLPLEETTLAPGTTAEPAETTLPPVDTTAPEKQGTVICIDPGHGYDDPGASTKFLGDVTESEVTLAIGLKLRDLLVARGYIVIMTHETNEIPAGTAPGEQYLFGLAKRTAYANEQNPDFYLSIHGDTFEDPSVQGSRVYFQSVTGEDNSAITATAQRFVDALTAELTDAKKAPMLKEMRDDDAYYVLRNVNAPAVLVEVGFASNQTDAANMLDEAWQARIAQALADGVDRNFGK